MHSGMKKNSFNSLWQEHPPLQNETKIKSKNIR